MQPIMSSVKHKEFAQITRKRQNMQYKMDGRYEHTQCAKNKPNNQHTWERNTIVSGETEINITMI